MTIYKAIEVLTDFCEQEFELSGDELREASLLGIEALKFLLEWRRQNPTIPIMRFHGETEA